LKFDTRSIHAGRKPDPNHGAIFQLLFVKHQPLFSKIIINQENMITHVLVIQPEML
jgi:hypothetical protein